MKRAGYARYLQNAKTFHEPVYHDDQLEGRWALVELRRSQNILHRVCEYHE